MGWKINSLQIRSGDEWGEVGARRIGEVGAGLGSSKLNNMQVVFYHSSGKDVEEMESKGEAAELGE